MITAATQAKLTVMASFPEGYFLENLAVREDNSILLTTLNQKELWYVPPSDQHTPAEPFRLHTFDQHASGIVELEPDIFYISSSNWYTTHESYLHRLDFGKWTRGASVKPEVVLAFPEAARGLNGSCAIAPGVILIADCFASLIWRVDLPPGGGKPLQEVWLRHNSVGYFPGAMKPEMPGVNGVRYSPRSNYLYYTSTAKKLFMRVPVNPDTHEPAGEPELVLAGRMGDDFCIDEDAKVAYLTTHRQNTIDRVSLDPAKNSGFTQSVAGDPLNEELTLNEELIGPTSAAWSRRPGDYGRVAFILTDGGTASPLPDGVRRPARLLRVDFPEVPEAL
jgi:hypothetical protein